MFLLDTVVLSELRKRNPTPAVVAWFQAQTDTNLFLSVLSVGEIQKGISAKRATNPEFANALSRWLDTLLRGYGDRVLPVTPEIARRWGDLSFQAGHSGADVLIAATALQHGLVVATRNIRHFEPLGVGLVNPFEPDIAP